MTGLRQDELPRPARPWGVPPPPAYQHSAPFEGAGVLGEVGGELGLALWFRLRDVELWSRTPIERRHGLFASARRVPFREVRAAPPELAEALAALAGMVASPQVAGAEVVARACSTISEWAAGQALLSTAAEFAELAAHVRPRDPLLAVAAGRVARKRADYDRAILWFQRAIALARRVRSPSAYVSVLLTWANTETQRGRPAAAKTVLLRAWRMARRHKLKYLAACTRHDLLQVTVETKEYEEAESHAQAAFVLYGTRSKNCSALAHDWTVLWINRGLYAAAIPILEALRSSFLLASERVILLSSLARAYGGAGDLEHYHETAEMVLHLAEETIDGVAGALASVALGAYSLGLRSRARELALRAMHLAMGRDEQSLTCDLHELIKKIEQGGSSVGFGSASADDQVCVAADRLLERIRRRDARA